MPEIFVILLVIVALGLLLWAVNRFLGSRIPPITGLGSGLKVGL